MRLYFVSRERFIVSTITMYASVNKTLVMNAVYVAESIYFT